MFYRRDAEILFRLSHSAFQFSFTFTFTFTNSPISYLLSPISYLLSPMPSLQISSTPHFFRYSYVPS